MRNLATALFLALFLTGTASAAPRPEGAQGATITQPPAEETPSLTSDPSVDDTAAEEPVDEEPVGDGEADEAGANEEKPVTQITARISTDLSALPAPVAALREKLIAAAQSGEIEKLAPLLPPEGQPFTASFGGNVEPIPHWKEMSGDGQGIEILSIMLEILDTGYAVVENENGSDLYVWPYFYAAPFDNLTTPQLVELYKLVTPADMEDMKAFGGYIFYRLGIAEDGTWQFFVAGD